MNIIHNGLVFIHHLPVFILIQFTPRRVADNLSTHIRMPLQADRDGIQNNLSSRFRHLSTYPLPLLLLR